MSQELCVKYYCSVLCRVVCVHFYSDNAQRHQGGEEDLPYKASSPMCKSNAACDWQSETVEL